MYFLIFVCEERWLQFTLEKRYTREVGANTLNANLPILKPAYVKKWLLKIVSQNTATTKTTIAENTSVALQNQ